MRKTAAEIAGRYLAILRMKSGKSIRRAAIDAGVDPATVSRLESGELGSATYRKLVRLGKVYDLTGTELAAVFEACELIRENFRTPRIFSGKVKPDERRQVS